MAGLIAGLDLASWHSSASGNTRADLKCRPQSKAAGAIAPAARHFSTLINSQYVPCPVAVSALRACAARRTIGMPGMIAFEVLP
jgi:hypothetical protein